MTDGDVVGNLHVQLFNAEKEKRQLTPADIAARLQQHARLNPEAWGRSPLDAALIRESQIGGKRPHSHAGPEANDGGTPDLSRTADLLDLLADPWNAVSMRLTDSASGATREVALQCALYCAAGEFQLWGKIHDNHHLPAWYDIGCKDPQPHPDEVANRNWINASDVADKLLLIADSEGGISPKYKASWPWRGRFGSGEQPQEDVARTILKWRDKAIDNLIGLNRLLYNEAPSTLQSQEGKVRPPHLTLPWVKKTQGADRFRTDIRTRERERGGQERGSGYEFDIF